MSKLGKHLYNQARLLKQVLSMGRRSRLEIYLEVLNAIKSGITKPTRIMYASNMSWNTSQKLLVKLVAEGLVLETSIESKVRKKREYSLTDKGLNFISHFVDAPVDLRKLF